ncbi:hypothetical protein [Haladaptatus sp. DYSN1]|uniref:hypothetical protein n=1 Tax=unclassified Haladaptatus TaxID=2622732 RepID=UPI00240550A4|nr:hypothetical protein [Haladaptatus sp. DYSN1]
MKTTVLVVLAISVAGCTTLNQPTTQTKHIQTTVSETTHTENKTTTTALPTPSGPSKLKLTNRMDFSHNISVSVKNTAGEELLNTSMVVEAGTVEEELLSVNESEELNITASDGNTTLSFSWTPEPPLDVIIEIHKSGSEVDINRVDEVE